MPARDAVMHSPPVDTEVLDVVVVGAGQAGLAAGRFLRQAGVSFRLFDRARRVGDSWRRRYDSLTLFSPRRYSSLPGLQMDGPPDGYPHKDEVADYLERYAQHVSLPVALGEGVAHLGQAAAGFHATTACGRVVAARAVIVATGPFQRSIVPPFAAKLPGHLAQFSADTYRHPAAVPPGRVLVVGGGGTGRQIAHELAPTHEVTLSVGRSPTITPQRLFGRDVIALFDTLGFLRADKGTLRGRLARANESFPGRHLRPTGLRRRGVRLRSRTVDAQGDVFRFADDSTASFDSVIWVLGYRDDTSWLDVPAALDPQGRYLQERGISPVPGLFHVGRSWQTCRASALLCGVSADAATIVERVSHWLSASR